MARLFALLAVVILLVGAIAAYQTFYSTPDQPTTASTPNTSPAGRPTMAASRDAAQSFDQKIAAVSSAAAIGRKSVHLVLTEQEVTSKIQDSMASAGITTLRNVVVKLGAGTATISATASLNGIDVPLDGDLRLTADSGLLSVDVTSLKAGGVNLPSALQRQVVEQAKQAAGLNDLHSIDVGIDVQKVQVTPGQLQIDGETRS